MSKLYKIIHVVKIQQRKNGTCVLAFPRKVRSYFNMEPGEDLAFAVTDGGDLILRKATLEDSLEQATGVLEDGTHLDELSEFFE